jgi:hypothetical protein
VVIFFIGKLSLQCIAIHPVPFFVIYLSPEYFFIFFLLTRKNRQWYFGSAHDFRKKKSRMRRQMRYGDTCIDVTFKNVCLK